MNSPNAANRERPEPDANSGDDPVVQGHRGLVRDAADQVDGEDGGGPEDQRREHLGDDVGGRGEQGHSELVAPSPDSCDGDHRAAAGGGEHGAVEAEADHDEGGLVAVADPVGVVAAVEPEREEEDDEH
jgi:hypothetical protein